MVKNLSFFSLLFIACAFVFVGCSKSAGPAGAAGAAGPAGASGADGAPGQDSVLYSAWMPMAMVDTIEANADTVYYQNFTANGITSEILNTGTVITYLQTVDNNGDSLIFNAATVLQESYYVGDIFVESFPAAASNSAGFNWAGYNYRFIVIPGAIATTRFSGMTKAQLTTLSYSSLTKAISIPGNKGNLTFSLQ